MLGCPRGGLLLHLPGSNPPGHCIEKDIPQLIFEKSYKETNIYFEGAVEFSSWEQIL